jgi:hypothetical protein
MKIIAKLAALVITLAAISNSDRLSAQCTSDTFDCDPLYDAMILWRSCAIWNNSCCIATHWAYRCTPGGTQVEDTIKVTASGDLCVAIISKPSGQIIGYSCF